MARIITLDDLRRNEANQNKDENSRKDPVTVLVVVFFTCLSLWALQSPRFLTLAAINPHRVFFRHEYYRILSCHFVHGSYQHLFLNMLAFVRVFEDAPGVGCGSRMEKYLGKRAYVLCLVTGLVLQPLLYSLLTFLSSHISRDLMHTSAIGFSGIVFQLITMEAFLVHHPSETRMHQFGLSLPAKFGPFVSLFASQFMGGNVSFLGHLAGILAGLILTALLMAVRETSSAPRHEAWSPVRGEAPTLSFPISRVTSSVQNSSVPRDQQPLSQSRYDRGSPSTSTNASGSLFRSVVNNICGPATRVATSNQSHLRGSHLQEPSRRRKASENQERRDRGKTSNSSEARQKEARSKRRARFEQPNDRKKRIKYTKMDDSQRVAKRKRESEDSNARDSKRARSIAGPPYLMQWKR